MSLTHRIKLDNKVRLSADVLDKAQAIADEWGLQNAKAAVEAVFRKYADDYMYGRQPQFQSMTLPNSHPASVHSPILAPEKPPFPGANVGFQVSQTVPQPVPSVMPKPIAEPLSQAALELDGLLGL